MGLALVADGTLTFVAMFVGGLVCTLGGFVTLQRT